jgi:hypothetical protein
MRGRLLIWVAAAGIALILFLRIFAPHQKALGDSPVHRIARVGVILTESANSNSSSTSESQSNPLQAADPPMTNTEISSPNEDDSDALAEKISSLSETEVRERLENLSSQDLTGNVARLLLRRWVELDPMVAVGWVTQLPDAAARQELTAAAGVAWSQKDLPAALGWLESLPEGDIKHRALNDIGYEVARIDPLNAMQIATQLPVDENSDALLLHAFAQYASADPSQSQQLALSLPSGSMRSRVLATMATVQAKQDGAQAAKFAIDNIPPGPELDRAVIGIVQIWAKKNFTQASAWVESFPDSVIRDQAMQSLRSVAGQ